MTTQQQATNRFAYYAFTVLIVYMGICEWLKIPFNRDRLIDMIFIIVGWHFTRSLRSSPQPPPPGGSTAQLTVTEAPKE